MLRRISHKKTILSPVAFEGAGETGRSVLKLLTKVGLGEAEVCWSGNYINEWRENPKMLTNAKRFGRLGDEDFTLTLTALEKTHVHTRRLMKGDSNGGMTED